MRTFVLASLVGLFGAIAVAGCGDKFGTGSFTTLGLKIDDLPADPATPVVFPQALQLPVSKRVAIENTGGLNSVLKVSSIDWDVGEDGTKLKNPYVEIDFLGGVDANSFPLEISSDPLDAFAFQVTYTPPLGKPLDDTRDSVLLIKSNAKDDNGKKAPELRVTFSFNVHVAVPRVTPDNYIFRNATPSKPESQDFHIYNDPDIATSSFHVTSVRLESNTSEFTLQNLPSSGAEVLAPGDPNYRDIVFTVTYHPVDNEPDTNALLIDTDVGGAPLRVPLSSNTIRGSYSLSYDNLKQFDFTNVSQAETRNVIIMSEGPGPITLRAPTIEPAEARPDYVVKAFIPATQAGQADTEVTAWPRALPLGKSIRVQVEFKPATGGGDTANGELRVPYEDPDPGTIVMNLFSGKPKSKLVLAPSTGNISVTGSAVAGETGTRRVVVYNEGNGPLSVSGIRVLATFDLPAKVWSPVIASAPFVVDPGGVHVIELAYDLAKISNANGNANETLFVDYHNDFTDTDTSASMGLLASNTEATNPVADPGSSSDYAGATVGAPVTLDGSGSTPGDGTFGQDPYIWYLTAKPAGSNAKLNTQSASTLDFTPDVAGSYTVELTVFSQDGDVYLYSAPVAVTFSVAE
ncbi:MAG: hypothetical protein U1F43_23810 [Myxococcota bacterium]